MSNKTFKSMAARDLQPIIVLSLACLFSVLLPFSLRPQVSSVVPTLLPGQSATILSDGKWLLIGGEANGQPLSATLIWDSRTGATTELSTNLQHARAWHTATVLPDGTVLIFGGVGSAGQLVQVVEIFDPDSQMLSVKPLRGLSSRARHTATLLTDGHVLFAGGVDSNGQTLATAELWDGLGNSPVVQLPSLSTPRRGHTATLTEHGTVLLRGGLAPDGSNLDAAELFDPVTERFSFVDVATLNPPSGNPILMSSIPAHNATEVDRDTLITLRFSKALRVETVSSQTITLSGPRGIEAAKIVPAEAGMLVFITPENDLLPGATYSVSVNGALDRDGLLLPVSGISFSTKPAEIANQPSGDVGSSPSHQPETRDPKPETALQTPDDDWEWKGATKNGKPHSDWQDLPPLQAPPGVTALAGQVLTLKGEPLSGVTLEMPELYKSNKKTAKTDDTGRFLLENIHYGSSTLVIDGRTANRPGRSYGVFKAGVGITKGMTNVLDFTIWMPRIDAAHAVKIPSPTISEVVATTPKIQGLEVRIPPDTVIYDHEGNIVTEISITPIPTDRPPFPLPDVKVPAYFTIQPGGGHVRTQSGTGVRLIYPNFKDTPEPPGGPFNFWQYDPRYIGWYIYGQGKVTEDGRQVVPDPGVSIYGFTGAMSSPSPSFPGSAPAEGPQCPFDSECDDGDPVNLGTGLFILKKTDLYLPDVLPISLTRTYRPRDTVSRPFGIGATHPYEMFLVGDRLPYTYVELILPDGGRIHYDRISPGTGYADAVYESTTSPTHFYKSTVAWNGSGWDLKLKDGTVYVFGDSAPLQAIRDRNQNQITIQRSGGQTGNITKITSPNGRWIEFTYGSGNRIAQAKDNLGRTVSYTYDGTGRLISVTDPNGGVTEYTYDSSSRMLTIKDARGIVFLTNEYDATGKVIKQTQADQGTYQFAYTTDSNGKIIQTDITNPRGHLRRVTFNAAGQILTDTRAFGTPEAQTTTYERQPGSNLVLARTDALNRRTEFAYDSKGNVTSVTRLAGTPDAVTTTYTYEPTFNQLATVTDPLNHTSSFSYDIKGNLTTITDPLGNQTTSTYNTAGQPTTITTPAGTTQFTYDFGDLVTVTDPLGNTTNRFVDAGGRLLGITNPLGLVTLYDYDTLNRLISVTDPLGGVTGFGYDPNGNLLTVTDARNSATTYAYNNMDRLQTRTDPLLRAESYVYDSNGNPTQFTDRKQQPTSSTYDALNRRTGVTYADGSTTAYTYDAGNRLTQIVDSVSGTITRTYDGLDRLTSETTPQGTVTYTYDAAGRRTSMTVSGQPSVGYTYDNADRLLQITQGSSNVIFTYDSADRRTSVTLPNGILTEYAYDAASRVTSITYKQGTNTLGDLTYEYDKAGNRTKIGGTFARTGVPQGVSSTAYNAANHQTTFGGKTLTYDNNGNLTSIVDGAGTTLYTWNARNQLTGISGPSVNASFAYDGLGRREKKTINTSLTEFLYDGVNPVQETSGATVLANILTGLGVDEFLTRTDVPAGTTSSFLPDGLGSAIALADSTGTVQTEYAYEPFGRTTVTGASSSNPFQYTGRESDATGLYYYRARYYHSHLQRFISEDPIEFYGGDVNLYAFVGNNPLTFVDPFGLDRDDGTTIIEAGVNPCRFPFLAKLCKKLGDAASDAIRKIFKRTPDKVAQKRPVPASDKQLGQKFGEHRDPNRAGYRTPKEYRDLADDIYSDPKATRTKYPADHPTYPGETHIQRARDLLRLDPEGNFRSLYPLN